MNVKQWLAGLVTATSAASAWAGSVAPLGVPLGLTALGTVLGIPVPIAGGGLLLVGAASLGIGIWIARRKQRR